MRVLQGERPLTHNKPPAFCHNVGLRGDRETAQDPGPELVREGAVCYGWWGDPTPPGRLLDTTAPGFLLRPKGRVYEDRLSEQIPVFVLGSDS